MTTTTSGTEQRLCCSCGWSAVGAPGDDRLDIRWQTHARAATAASAARRGHLAFRVARHRWLQLTAEIDLDRRRRRDQRLDRLIDLGAIGRVPSPRPPTAASGRHLGLAVQLSGMSACEAWIEFVALGGTATRGQLEEWLCSAAPLDRESYNLMATVLNERFRAEGFGQPLDYWEREGGG